MSNVGHPFLYMGTSQTMLLLCEVNKCQDSKNITIKNPKEECYIQINLDTLKWKGKELKNQYSEKYYRLMCIINLSQGIIYSIFPNF